LRDCQRLIKKNPDEQGELTEEDIALRAYSSAELLRTYRGEEIGFVLDMTREQQLDLITRSGPVANEVAQALNELLGDDLPIEPLPDGKPLV